MLITTLTTIIMCLTIHSTVANQDYITNYQNITVSSVLQYMHYNYDPINVVDQNHGTLPDDCECCWVSHMERNPTITLLLKHPTVIGLIELLGRTDGNDFQLLSGITILIDGQNRTAYKHYDSNNNKVTVRMPPEKASSITIHRPKTNGVWNLTICEIKAYRSVNIADRASITVSSFLPYPVSMKGANVIDGSNRTRPNECGCCWHSNQEVAPKLSLLLKEPAPVVFIEIIGRSDAEDAPRSLTGTSIILDGANKSHDQTSEGHYVYLSLPSSTFVQNITLIRPRPLGGTTWFLIICEIKVFSPACNKGSYGVNCSNTCSEHCMGGINSCDPVTGKCAQVNIADRASITVSSFLPYPVSMKGANVIDGSNRTRPNECGCCWHSNQEVAPKLSLLLKEPAPVVFIEIIGRSDAEDAPRILTGTSIIVDGANKSHDQTSVGHHVFLPLPSSTFVQNITLIRPRPLGGTTWCLIICEIKVFSLACNKGNYGMNCSNICSEFCMGGINNCDTVTGACASGCLTGYIGDKCDQEVNGSIGKIAAIAGGCLGAVLVLILTLVYIHRYRIYKRQQFIEENYVTYELRTVQSNANIYDTLYADAGTN